MAISEDFEEGRGIEWENFSVAELEKYLNDDRRVLVLGLPQTVELLCANTKAEVDTPRIRRACRGLNHVMMKFEYRPFSTPQGDAPREIEWMHEHGGYKEPWIVIVRPGGEMACLKNIYSNHRINGFLEINLDLALFETRTSRYWYFALASLVFWGTFLTILKRGNKTCG